MGNKRWAFILAGNVEITHLYNDEGDMIGMLLETDFETAECYSPQEVTNAVDRWINMAQFTGSIH